MAKNVKEGRSQTYEGNEAVDVSPNNDLTTMTKEDSISNLLKTRKWLQAQLLEHECATKSADYSKAVTIEDDPENILKRICNLQEDLKRASADSALQELMCERLQNGQALMTNLFPSDESVGDTESIETKRKQILLPLVEEQTALVSSILRLVEGIKKERSLLLEQKKENLELKTSNKELMDNLQKQREEQEKVAKRSIKNPEIKRLAKNLDNLAPKVELIRHSLQGLIVGSGINWADKPDTAEMVVSLGQPLESLFQDD